MAAPTETYIDPNIAGDSGTGAIGDPYGDVQWALDQVGRDGANGDRFNVKAGTDELLTGALDVTGSYGTPDAGAPLIFQGYTTAAGDGGIGGVSGNNSVAVIDSVQLDYITFIDMHLHNTGANTIIGLDNFCYFINCEIDNNSSGSGLDLDQRSLVIGCYIHDIAGRGVNNTGFGLTIFCHFENDGGADMTTAVTANSQSVMFCTFDIDGATDGILVGGGSGNAIGNSIYSTAGTGRGIVSEGIPSAAILSNVIEGFSGVGGIGIEVAGGDLVMLGHNAFYNNTTNETLTGDVWLDLGNDIVLAGAGNSPFIDAANDDFRIKPSVQALGYPTANYLGLAVRNYLDIGALQRMSQMLTHPGMAGGARG